MEERKTKVTLNKLSVDNTQPDESSRKEDAKSFKKFVKDIGIDIKSLSSEEIVFDIKGIEPSLANALRRIMISEVPTMAIEKVRIW